MNPFLAALAAAADDEPGLRDDRRRTNPEALCMTLREVAERYAKPCPFHPGQIVTPRPESNTKGAGEPHIVLEVIDRPDPDFTAASPQDGCSNAFGARRDIRVACEGSTGNISKFWLESGDLELYTGPGAGLDKAEAA